MKHDATTVDPTNPNSTTNHQHKHTERSKIIELVSKDPNSSTNHQQKYPVTHKGARSNIVKQNNSDLNTETGKIEECKCLSLNKDKKVWKKSFANELGRLTQDIDYTERTNRVDFTHHSDVPSGKKVARICVFFYKRTQKE